jgi:hypothetical protein
VDTLSVVKTDERSRARELRALGWSIGEIERAVDASRGSISLWVRDVVLDDIATARLLERAGLGPMRSAERSAARARARRAAYQAEGRRLVHERGPRYAAGCMLYWAEGEKSRNQLKLANSDPDLLLAFARFLRTEFDVRPDAIKLRCNLFADHLEQQTAIERFWLTTLGLPPTSLRKSTVNVYSKSSQKKRVNKLPYGTCEIRVDDTRILQTIYGSIQEYGGFERPEWLD